MKSYIILLLCGCVSVGFSIQFIGYVHNVNSYSVVNKTNTNSKSINGSNAIISNKSSVNVNTGHTKVVSKTVNKTVDNAHRTSNINIAKKILDDNLISLSKQNQRSNGARYALLGSNIRVGIENPVLGVGSGLATAYIIDNYTYEERQYNEVKMWIKNFYKNGVFASNFSMGTALNEYITRFAQNGILGLLVFLFPFIFIIGYLFKMVNTCEKNNQLELLFILFSILCLLVAGCNSSVNVVFAIWPILGLGYSAYFSSKEEGGI